jgi:sugar phosphate isomerase/epimerase
MKSVNRRGFLARVSGGLAGLSAGLAVARSQPWTLRLSASSIAFCRLPIEQACERIARLGFEGIDIWSAYAGCPHLDDIQKRLGPEGLKALLAHHKLELFAFSVYVGGYTRYAELLGKAGGGVAVTGSAGPCAPGELVPRMRAFLEGMKPQAELAEKQRTQIAIENHSASLLDSIDSIKAFVDLNRNPRLGIALAPFHIQARGESVAQAILAARSQLLFFYAWQYDPAMSVKQLPGLGPADCAPWMAALAKIQYRGYVNPFLHDQPAPEPTAQALGKSRDYLRECCRKAVPA